MWKMLFSLYRYTKVSDKKAYANNADPDQMVCSLIRVYTVAILLSILKNNCIKSKS